MIQTRQFLIIGLTLSVLANFLLLFIALNLTNILQSSRDECEILKQGLELYDSRLKQCRNEKHTGNTN